MKTETKYAVINADGIVENIIVADVGFAREYAKATGNKVILADNTPAWIGGEYADGQFIAKPVEVPAGAA